MELRKFSLKLILLIPVFGLVIGLNYQVDPANLFRDSYERGIADLLLEGRNIANCTNNDDRLVQKLYIDGSSKPKDIVIFGSSHAMSIHACFFGGKTVFNHSVAIAEVYRQRGMMPGTIIVSLDPWLLNRNNGQLRWISLVGDYQAAVRRLSLPSNSMALPVRFSLSTKIYMELISPSYFQESLRFWSIGLEDPQLVPGKYYVTEEAVGNVAICLSDGSLSRSTWARSRDPDVDDVGATDALENFNHIDPIHKKMFELWISSLQKDGVQVVFLLAPYHPKAYSYLVHSPDYRIILDVQSYYEQFAHQSRILLLGSFDPADIPCSADEFYDEQHAKESCLERILSNEFGSN